MNRVCIGCGCTDKGACVGGCRWVHEASDAPLGICSTCALDINVQELESQAFDWSLEYGDADDDDSSLLLPGDPEYHATLREGR